MFHVSNIAYIDTDHYVFYSYALDEITTHTTNHNSAHNTVITVIPYALGLTQSIAYCRNCLVNKETAIIVKMTLCVGIRYKFKYWLYIRYQILTIAYAACCFDCVFYGIVRQIVKKIRSLTQGID